LQECILEDRPCDGCGECRICDLDPQKQCDNCCLCIGENKEMRTVIIKRDEEEQPLPKRKIVRWNPQK